MNLQSSRKAFVCKCVTSFCVTLPLILLLLQLGCAKGFVSGKFILANDSPLPSWLDEETAHKLAPFEVKYTLYETTFTTTGHVTVQVVSTNITNPIIHQGKWCSINDNAERPKEGDSSFTRMEIDGTVDVYEFFHLKQIIRVHSKGETTRSVKRKSQ
jgi:hypothetical protein